MNLKFGGREYFLLEIRYYFTFGHNFDISGFGDYWIFI